MPFPIEANLPLSCEDVEELRQYVCLFVCLFCSKEKQRAQQAITKRTRQQGRKNALTAAPHINSSMVKT